jgi:hypothetical protein
MSEGGPISFMVQKNSVITDSYLIAQTKPQKSFWGKETPVPLVFSLYITNSVLTTDALDGEVVLGTVHIPAGSPILTADYRIEGWSEAFVLGDAEINLQQDPKGKRFGSLSVSSAWLGMTAVIEENIEPQKCDIIRERLNN